MKFAQTRLVLLTMFCVGATIAQSFTAFAQQSLSITSPSTNTVVTSGSTIAVNVAVPTGTKWSEVALVVEQLGLLPGLTSPPYTFSFTIPQGFIGYKKIYATAVDVQNNEVESTPISLVIKPGVAVTSFNASSISFAYVGQMRPLNAAVIFADGSSAITDDLIGTLFSTDNTAIASVDIAGNITAVGPGRTNIRVTYGSVTNIIPVFVPHSVRGDLNADGTVDLNDLAIIQAALNTTANGSNDARDLNHDGKIDINDARLLTTLCTHPRCASR